MQTLLANYAGIVLDRQHVLDALLGEHNWGADIDTGTITFEEPGLECPFEIVGSYAYAQKTWLWAWANQSLPEHMTGVSRKLLAYGQSHNVTKLTEERFPAQNEELHAFGVLACGIGGADAYYAADYGDGILVAALTGDIVASRWQPDHARLLAVFPQVIRTFDLNHRAALRSYCNALGYTVTGEDLLTATRDGNTVTAAFDEQGRLADITAHLR